MTGFPSLQRVAEAWGLRVSRMQPLAAGHGAQQLVHTTDGLSYVLKRVRVPDRDVRVVRSALAAAHHVAASSGAPQIASPRPLTSRPDEVVLEHSGELFYLAPFIAGRKVSFRRPEEVASVLDALGRLHVSGAELIASLAAEAPSQLAAVQSDPTVGYRETIELVRTAKAGLSTWLLGRKLDELSALVDIAEETLADLPAKEPGPQARTLLHGDSHANNYLVRTAAGSIACTLIDVESFEAGFGVKDILVPLRYLGAAVGWRREPIESALQAYEAHRPLPPGERILLAAQLALPRLWQRGAKSLLKKNVPLRDTGAWAKVLTAQRQLKRHRAFIAGFRNP